MNKAPASEYWLGFFQRFPNVQGVILDKIVVPFGDIIDIPIEKIWRRQANEKTIVLPEKERQGLAFQKIFVVKDTSIVDCDVLKFSRITKNLGRKRFELIKLGAKNHRLWEIPDVGPRINRGLHLGRPDDILIGPFKPKEDNAKKKAKEKVKIKTKANSKSASG